LVFFLCLACQSATYDRQKTTNQLMQWYLDDFRRLPGITDQEVAAIEDLAEEGRILTFGTTLSDEAFVTRQGDKGGFLIHFAGALSGMLGLKFEQKFVARRDMIEALAEGRVDLSAEIPYNSNNQKNFLMTDPVFERLVKTYRRRSDPPGKQPYRYGIPSNSGISDILLPTVKHSIEVVMVNEDIEAAEYLFNYQIDLYLDEASADKYFAPFSGLVSGNYFPPVKIPHSLSTSDPSLEAIIRVAQRFLDAGGQDYLFDLYSQSSEENRRIFFEESLSQGQSVLLDRRRERGGPIKVAVSSEDYPEVFYNERNQEYEGIIPDILKALEGMTGLDFVITNPPGTQMEELKEMLSTGQVDILGDFNYIEDNYNHFVLSDLPLLSDRYALLTTLNHPDIEFSQIGYQTAGLVRNNDFTKIYQAWFPQSQGVIYYRSMPLALEALQREDIDFVMASNNYLLYLTNYLEQPLFKAGYVFDQDIPTGFAYQRKDRDLAILIDRAMTFIDINHIKSRWYSRLFDYRHKFFKDAAPFVIIFCLLLLFSVSGLVKVNARNRRLNRNLETMVTSRTSQLMATQVDLEREKQLMSSIVDSCPVSLIITKKGRILFLNPFARSFLGKRAGDHLEESFIDIGVYDEYSKIVDDGFEINWRPTRLKRADGEVRETLINTFTSDYYGESAHMSWVTDVTELRNNARALSLARDIAEDSARAKSEFLANLSHEIRTPMNAILGLTQLTLQSELNETQRDYLEKTAAAAKSLLGIINDILDFSKIEAGKLLMEKIDFLLDDVLDGVISLFTFKAGDKNLELVLSVEPNVQTKLVGDPLRLSQVLNNLMGNAMKFTDQGGVTLFVSQTALDIEGAPYCELCFKVKDTGIGLSKEQIDNLFTAFNQADSSFTRRYGGTGLGLAISKSLVEMMDGRIWVEGEPGVGSTFSFTARLGLSARQRVYCVPVDFLQGRTILAVDDYPDALEVLDKNLTALGLSVVTATSGPEALKVIKEKSQSQNPLELAVIDTLEGEIDAYKLASEILSLPEPRPILIRAAIGQKLSGAGRGFQAVISKPITVAALTTVLGDVLKVKTTKGRRRRAASGHEEISVAHLKGSKILLAEDNEVNQLVASRILKNAGLEVDVAQNGEEAVEMVKNVQYDLVLMDIQMPVMDGLSATKAIRAMPGFENLPIVAMTAHAMSGDREQSLAVGMNDHVTKPINLPELFGALNHWIKPGSLPSN
jgi:signal transduction histidine kinase/CheY-like chemotaxis protein/ABC-type amino acid transport substrate-binding protein